MTMPYGLNKIGNKIDLKEPKIHPSFFSYIWSQVGEESIECPKDFWHAYDPKAAECLTDPTKDNVHVKCDAKVDHF